MDKGTDKKIDRWTNLPSFPLFFLLRCESALSKGNKKETEKEKKNTWVFHDLSPSAFDGVVTQVLYKKKQKPFRWVLVRQVQLRQVPLRQVLSRQEPLRVPKQAPLSNEKRVLRCKLVPIVFFTLSDLPSKSFLVVILNVLFINLEYSNTFY